MPNNKMYLVHIPTGLAVSLGKRMGQGWYIKESASNELAKNIAKLYDVLDSSFNVGAQDDFAIALEDADKSTLAIGNWKYGLLRDDGLTQLLINYNT